MNISPLIQWVNERELIRRRKEAGEPPPWSDDPLFTKYRWCNVRREDDRVTRWVREHIREPYANHPHLWFMLCIARTINWPPTLQELYERDACPDVIGAFEPRLIADVLDDRTARGEKVWTGAYMINAVGAEKYRSKALYVGEVVLGRIWGERDRIAHYFASLSPRQRKLEAVFLMLRYYRGWGNFMAYQAVVDMRFTPLLREARDRDEWAAAGPGTVYGLNYTFGRPRQQALSQRQALEEMRIVAEVLREETDVEFDFSDVPNILCETAKYLRLQREDIPPRVLYKPFEGGW